MRDIKPKKDKYRTSMIEGPKESKPIYPTMRLDLEHIPEAKKWTLGKEYPVGLKLRLVGLSQSRFDNSAEFEIIAIDPKGKGLDDGEKGDE